MKLCHTRLEIGVEKPLRFLHITDSHLAFADERDDGRKQELARRRRDAFDGADSGRALRELDAMLDYARSCGGMVLHTGDLIDFVSRRNLELVREKFSGLRWFCAAGNHEFSKYVGEAWEDEAYKLDSLPLVAPAFPNDLRFASRLVGGVNLVAVDNGYYLFRREELERLRSEAEQGYPILLLLHTPLYTGELYREVMEVRRAGSASLAGCPDEKLAAYEEYRRRQQRPDAATLEFIRFLEECPQIRAVFAGHLHFDFETRLPGGITQYVTGGGFRGCARQIEIV